MLHHKLTKGKQQDEAGFFVCARSNLLRCCHELPAQLDMAAERTETLKPSIV